MLPQLRLFSPRHHSSSYQLFSLCTTAWRWRKQQLLWCQTATLGRAAAGGGTWPPRLFALGLIRQRGAACNLRFVAHLSSPSSQGRPLRLLLLAKTDLSHYWARVPSGFPSIPQPPTRPLCPSIATSTRCLGIWDVVKRRLRLKTPDRAVRLLLWFVWVALDLDRSAFCVCSRFIYGPFSCTMRGLCLVDVI